MKPFIHKPLEIKALQWNLENTKLFEGFFNKNPLYKFQCFEGGRLVILRVQGFNLVLEIGDWLIQDWNNKLITKTNREFQKEFSPKDLVEVQN
jgi:hypothetical protein